MHTRYPHDLAISAVSFDTLLVGELTTRLASRLGSPPAWAIDTPPPAEGLPGAALQEDASRVVLVLMQRLWGTDELTAMEAAILRLRARRAPRSVVLVTLDDTALPAWMARLRHRSLAAAGIAAAADFVLDAIADAGGAVLAKPAPAPAAPDASSVRWPEPPAPFLAQTRAHSALRRELESLGATLQTSVDLAKRCHSDRTWELHKVPHRVVACLDDVGITFSWIPGHDGTVAGGRLMVIEWTGITAGRGIAALRTARPARECVYRVEAQGPDVWCWRVDGPNGRASSTCNLASEWVAGASVTTRALHAASASGTVSGSV